LRRRAQAQRRSRRFPLDQIDRIEILRGPASSLYGADAIGGVVQVFTRRGTAALTGNASAGYGTYGTWDVKGGIAGTSGPVQFAVQAAAKASNGFNAFLDPTNFQFNDDKDGYKNQSVSANVGFTGRAGTGIQRAVFPEPPQRQFDGGAGFDDRTITWPKPWQVAVRNVLMPFWVSRLSAGAGIDDSETKTSFGDSPFKTTQRQYAWQNEFTLACRHADGGIRAPRGARGYRRRIRGHRAQYESVFGIYQLRVDDHALQANLRRDDSSQYGGKTTGSIAYGYRFVPSLRVTAGYATGFKAPLSTILYFPGFDNPSLVPKPPGTSKAASTGTATSRAQPSKRAQSSIATASRS
jgi:vitamin B12 transporter